MTFARSTNLHDLTGVVTDPGVWVFAAGSAAISALLAWAISRFARSMQTREVCLVAAATPVLTLIGIWYALRPGELGLASYLSFLAQPDVLLGLAIWFIAGLASAAAVCVVARSRKYDRTVAIFE